MLRKKGNRPYRGLATYFDLICGEAERFLEDARNAVLGSILPSVESGCDIACGTGTTALAFAARGLRMYGVDLSPTMCRLARGKARRIGLPLRVFHADMCDFRLPEPVDLVTCEYDAINHIPRKQDLARVAKSVAAALRPGGHFYFDTNTRLAFQRLWPSTFFKEEAGVAMVLHGGYDREHEMGWCHVEWFVKVGRLWRRHHERVEQVAWTAAEIKATLRAAGFDKIRSWDSTRLVKTGLPMLKGARTFWLAQKAGL